MSNNQKRFIILGIAFLFQTYSCNGMNLLKQCFGHKDSQKKAINGTKNNKIKTSNEFYIHSVKTLKGHTHEITCLAPSPCGNKLYSASRDDTIRIWDVKAEICLKVLRGHKGYIRHLILSSNGKKLFAAAADIKIWNTETGECLKTLNNPEKISFRIELGRSIQRFLPINSFLLSPDEKKLFSAAADIKIWNAGTGECLKKLKGAVYSRLLLSHDGKKLFSTEGNDIKIYNTKTGEILRTLTTQSCQNWSIDHEILSPDGQKLFAMKGETIIIWNLKNGGSRTTLQSGYIGMSMELSPNGKKLFYGGYKSVLQCWDIKIKKCLYSKKNSTCGLTISPNEKILFSKDDNKSILIYDAETGKLLTALRNHDCPTDQHLKIASNGKKLFIGTNDIKVYGLPSSCWKKEPMTFAEKVKPNKEATYYNAIIICYH